MYLVTGLFIPHTNQHEKLKLFCENSALYLKKLFKYRVQRTYFTNKVPFEFFLMLITWIIMEGKGITPSDSHPQ